MIDNTLAIICVAETITIMYLYFEMKWWRETTTEEINKAAEILNEGRGGEL